MTSPVTAPPRDQLIDVLRCASAAVVVTMHWLSTRTVWDAGSNSMSTHLALAGPVVLVLGWLLQVMPVLFLVGGVANTAVIDRHAAAGRRYADYLGVRSRRLLTPIISLAALFVPVIVAAEAIAPGIGALTGTTIAKPLWFLAVYLLCVAAAPLAVRLHDTAPWTTAGALLAVIVACDIARIGFDASWVGPIVWAAVWLACHQWGIAYARRSFHSAPAWALAAGFAVIAVTLFALVRSGAYPVAMLGMADHADNNLAPPTLVMALYGLAQALVIVAAVRAARGRIHVTVPAAPLAAANTAMMGVYIWHIPVLVALTGVALVAPTTLMPSSETAFWALRPWWFAAAAITLIPALRYAAWFERLWSRVAVTPHLWRVALGTALGAAGTYGIWVVGIGVTPMPLAWLVAVAAGVALLSDWSPRRRAGSHQPPQAHERQHRGDVPVAATPV